MLNNEHISSEVLVGYGV